MGEYQGASRRKMGLRSTTQLSMCMRKVGGRGEVGRLFRDQKCVMLIHLSGS